MPTFSNMINLNIIIDVKDKKKIDNKAHTPYSNKNLKWSLNIYVYCIVSEIFKRYIIKYPM